MAKAQRCNKCNQLLAYGCACIEKHTAARNCRRFETATQMIGKTINGREYLVRMYRGADPIGIYQTRKAAMVAAERVIAWRAQPIAE